MSAGATKIVYAEDGGRMGLFDGLLGLSPILKLEQTPEGPRITDRRTELAWLAPTEGELIPGFAESPVSPAFDGGFRLGPHPVEVRLRLIEVTVPPGWTPEPNVPLPPAPVAGPELAHDVCVHFADARTEGEPLAGVAQGWQLEAWRVDGAAASIYPLAKPEGRFDMEECHVLVKGRKGAPPQAAILTKLFSTKSVSPALWSDLNGRMNETLAWGGPPRTPPQRALSFYVDAGMALTPEAKSAAAKLAGELDAAAVSREAIRETAANVQRFAYGSDPPDEALGEEVRSLLGPAFLEAIGSPRLRAAVEQELGERVKTYRDFRGLHLFLEEVSRTSPGTEGKP
jgi:hypothetical protein